MTKEEQPANSKPNKTTLYAIWPQYRGEMTGTAIVLATTITVSCFYWAKKNPEYQAQLHRLFMVLSVAWALIATNWYSAIRKMYKLKNQTQEEGNKETEEKNKQHHQ